MSKLTKRLLSLACSAALLLGMLPGAVAAAEPEVTVADTETVRFVEVDENGVRRSTKEEVTTVREMEEPAVQVIPQKEKLINRSISAPSYPSGTFSLVEESENWYTFTAFADLQQLAAMESDYWICAEYVGEGALVIEEDLVLPEYFELRADQMVVPAGVTFTTDSYFSLNDLTVNGTANLDYADIGTITVNGMVDARYIYVQASLTVNGTCRIEDQISLGYGAILSGKENISFKNEWSGIWIPYEVDNTAQLLEVVALADANADSRIVYSIDCNNGLNLTQSVSLPENCELNVFGQLIVPAGVVFSAKGYVYANELVVDGSVNFLDVSVNTMTVNGSADVDYLYLNEALIVNGTYFCRGTIRLQEDAVLTGSENIVFADQWCEIYQSCEVSNIDQLLEVIERANADPYRTFDIRVHGDLNLTQSVSLPEGSRLNVYGQLVISSGVTLSASEYLYAEELIVNGALKLSRANVTTMVVNGTAEVEHLNVEESLTINGTYICKNYINLYNGATLIGEENIIFEEEWCAIRRPYDVYSAAELMEAVATANAAAGGHVEYEISIWEEITLPESVTIPASCSLDIRAAMTIPAGCTLTLMSRTYLYAPVTVEGTLVNVSDSWVLVSYSSGGLLTFAPGSGYTGNGELRVVCHPEEGPVINDPAEALPGLDMDNFECQDEYKDEYEYFWNLVNVTGLVKLAAPINPEWGYQRDRSEVRAMPGAISWQPQEPTQSRAEIKVYRVGEENYVIIDSWHFGGTELPEWRTIESFCMDDPDSGTYYFTVASRGDYIQYRSSDVAISDPWTYVKPDAKLGTCSNLSWEWPYVSYTAPAGGNVGGYEVQFFFADSPNAEPEELGGTLAYNMRNDWIFSPEMREAYIMGRGLGYYYFRVRPLSADITVACNGDWSEMSPAYNLTELSMGIENELEEVLNDVGNLTDDEIRDAVQSMDTEELKSAMLADQAGTGVMADIAELENAVGGAAGVTVTPEAQAFDPSQISIVGANLNNAASQTDPITLVIDKPEEDHVLDALYDSSVAVKFSMDLANVEDSENLEVPVMITLPVPANINPDFLVIIHYHANGTREELMPPRVYVRWENGQWLASFALTSFSDFVMTQLAPGCSHSGGTATCLEQAVCQLCGESYGELDMTNHVGETEWNMTSYSHSQTYTCCGAEAMAEASHTWAGTTCAVCGYEMVIQEGLETTPMYRLYNPNSGEHFYTGSVEERDTLQAAGWQYEGVAWNAPTQTGQNVFRLYNPNSGDHHYTMSAEEREMLVGVGWIYEGVCWNSSSIDTLPLFRLYNPNADCGSHHYTGSVEEREMLVQAGWHYEGIGWFGTLQ